MRKPQNTLSTRKGKLATMRFRPSFLYKGYPCAVHAGVPVVSAVTHLEREDERERERDEREREEPARERERERLRLRETLCPAGNGDLPPASLPTTGACSDNYHSLPEPPES